MDARRRSRIHDSFAITLALFGCSAQPSGLDDVARSPAAFDGLADVDERGPARELAHPSAGYLAVDGAPIVPWCSAVLVGPDVVVTAAHCLHDVQLEDLGFALGATRHAEDAIPVVAALVHPDADDPRHAVAALRLDAPIEPLVGADLRDEIRDRCDLRSVSYLFALPGDAGGRWTWTGCSEVDGRGLATIEVAKGTPNCHGDQGAGIFAEADGGLVGVVTGALYPDAGQHCASELKLATVADNAGFFDDALAGF